jgi:recombinational DNA repair protein (RecF pathway)
MQPQRDLAVVLKTIPYEERHRIVTALTENHGLVSAMARNSIQSRRFGGTLEVFAASEWLFVEKPGADLLRLEEASIRRSYEGIRRDFERMSLASVLSELVAKIAPRHDPCPELFRLHCNALAYLEEKALAATTAKGLHAVGEITGDDLSLLNGYLAKLLQWSGHQPQLDSCLGCQIPIDRLEAEASLTCLVAEAGWVCPECRGLETRHVREKHGQSFHQSQLRMTPGAVRDFHLSLSQPIRQIPSLSTASRREHEALFRFLESLVAYHLPGFEKASLKGLRFLSLDSTGLAAQGGRTGLYTE